MLLHQCHDSLAVMIETCAAAPPRTDAPALVAAIQAFLRGDREVSHTPDTSASLDSEPQAHEAASDFAEDTGSPAPVAVEDAPATPAPPQPERDPELVEIFLEEADEILESAGSSLEQWIGEQDNLIQAIHGYVADPAGFSLPAVASAAPAPTEAPPPAPTSQDAPATSEHADDDYSDWESDSDPEILEIFLEESDELAEIIDACLTSWKDHPESTDFTDDLKRAAYPQGRCTTGRPEAAGRHQPRLRNLSATAGKAPRSAQEDFQPMINWYDQIVRGMESVARSAHRQPAAAPPESSTALAPAAEKPQPQQPKQDDRRQRQSQAQPQEMVRVGADVLEALVNLAGETSINRGRVEQGISEFTFNVEEMGNTVQRLYEQLRRLDSETEAQIMSNYQQGVEREIDEDFDPLEMDQYSELHQITKQLSESASDLLDLKNTLLDRTKDTETLLLQQSRINTELQEKLMRTRMVPFSRLVPRLRRIVRQISGEVDKRVDFDVLNPEGELDRSLMERVVAPLEHMLRNAVDHGIETREGRQSAGKNDTGRINLELGREGGEVITLSDDGKGIDTDAVRKQSSAA